MGPKKKKQKQKLVHSEQTISYPTLYIITNSLLEFAFTSQETKKVKEKTSHSS